MDDSPVQERTETWGDRDRVQESWTTVRYTGLTALRWVLGEGKEGVGFLNPSRKFYEELRRDTPGG